MSPNISKDGADDLSSHNLSSVPWGVIGLAVACVSVVLVLCFGVVIFWQQRNMVQRVTAVEHVAGSLVEKTEQFNTALADLRQFYLSLERKVGLLATEYVSHERRLVRSG
jgi:high-affinity Fe2+/Pb2+ permease